jgi:hypothetical protein
MCYRVATYFRPQDMVYPLQGNNIIVSLDVINMFRSLIYPVKRLIFIINYGASEVSKVCYRVATYFWPYDMVYPLNPNNIIVSLDVIIMFRSLIFPVKRLIFMITNGANVKYEISKVCYRVATHF